jgi:uncharacterized membrane protein YgcG
MRVLLSFLALCLLFLPSQAVSAASLDNFRIIDFVVDMQLSKDKDGRSTLRTTETIRANFQAANVNHGLERAFVKDYNNHSTSFNLESVTDERGTPLEYHWEDDALRIGDKFTYVQGLKTYKITYTQRDVTREYEDTGKAEFYWDAIGVDWRVPIDVAMIRLKVDESIQDDIKTELNCYEGLEGSSQTCSAEKQADGTYIATVNGLAPNNGMSVALGFGSNTFTEYEPSLYERFVQVWIFCQIVIGIIAFGVLIVLAYSQKNRNNRTNEIGTIIPEYLPLQGFSVTTSGKLANKNNSVGTAQLLDFAVRHYIKIYEVKEKRFFMPAEYEIEIEKDLSDLLPEEKEILSDMFDGVPAVGSRLNLKKLTNSTKFRMSTLDNQKKLQDLVRGQYRLKEENHARKSRLRKIAILSAIIGAILISPPLLVFAFLIFLLSFNEWRLTDKGLALKRYLEGLKMYIEVAEEDRIRMLQSPEGAEKVAEMGDGKDVSNRVVLYERVLPYAVLFGKEKEWNKQLGMYYESAHSQPGWYSSQSGVFTAAAFSSSMTSFSTAAAVSGASSASGGSSGGGSSGGGGGGGGGGGW